MADRKLPISVQMYTLRDHVAKDLLGTITQVAKIGFHGIELAFLPNIPAPEFKKFLDDQGIVISGAHIPVEHLESPDCGKLIDTAKALGMHYLIAPWWPEDRRQNVAGWIKNAQNMEVIGAKIREAGLVFCYHNHAFEFQKFEGKTGWDIFLSHVTPQNVQLELDCYWVTHAGLVPEEIIRQNAGRVPLIHVKDMAAGPEKKFANVGAGIMNWPSILETAEQNGAQWFIVEQDFCYEQDPLDAIRTSFANLKKMGKV